MIIESLEFGNVWPDMTSNDGFNDGLIWSQVCLIQPNI